MWIGLLSATSTFLFFRYFSSILYGCLAPVGNSNVITSVGPVESLSLVVGVGWSEAGPMAGFVAWAVNGTPGVGEAAWGTLSFADKVEGSGGDEVVTPSPNGTEADCARSGGSDRELSA